MNMNRRIFEGRFLVNIVGAIIRQDALRPVRGRTNWDRMFHFADYHRIANMVYIGMLGNGEKIPERWRESFFDRYVQGLRYSEIREEAEREILTLLDMNKVSCLILESSRMQNLYQMPEMSYTCPLKLLVSEESYSLVKGYFIDLGYETDLIYKGYGERMKNGIGFRIEIYRKLPFYTKFYQKNMEQLVKFAYVKAPYKFVRGFSLEGQFVYLMAQCIYHYVQDELRIRQVLDLYLYYKAWQEQLNWEFIKKELTAFRIDELSVKLLALSYMWFGSIDDLNLDLKPDNLLIFDVMENRILSRTPTEVETDQQAIGLAKRIQKEQEKEKRRELRKKRREDWKKNTGEFKRNLRWLFPEYKYMRTMYVALEYFPPLLPVFWLVRLIRFAMKRFS